MPVGLVPPTKQLGDMVNRMFSGWFVAALEVAFRINIQASQLRMSHEAPNLDIHCRRPAFVELYMALTAGLVTDVL